MAYISTYEYDVFLSYALADNPLPSANEAVGIRPNWVTQFKVALEYELQSRIGGAPLRIFHDRHNASGGDFSIPAFTDMARKSAVFLAVVSPAYVTSHTAGGEKPFSLKEFDAFIGSGAERLADVCAIELLPPKQYFPGYEQLREKIAVRFWGTHETTIPHKLQFHEDTYRLKVGDIAETLARKLESLRAKSQGQPPAPPGAHGTVLLGQVTDDLIDRRDQMRRHLEQFDVRVLPDGGYYPFDRPGFTTAFNADLEKCDLFVQLLSDVSGRVSGEIPTGYPGLQAELAEAAKKPEMKWRKLGLNIDEVADANARRLLEGANVRAEDPSTFATAVMEMLEQMKNDRERAKQEEQERITEQQLHEDRLKRGLRPPGQRVFINAQICDMKTAEDLGNLLVKEGHRTILPLNEGRSEHIDEDLRRNLLKCDALVLLYGEVEVSWVRLQLNEYWDIEEQRAKPLQVLALYVSSGKEQAIGMLDSVIEVKKSPAEILELLRTNRAG